jgi:rhamnulokinase
MAYHLAVDLGASSGKLILGSLESGKLVTEEVYRFENHIIPKEGSLCWNLPLLFDEIKKGIKKCVTGGKKPVSISIDTWGVDFVLLDKKNQMLGEAVSYRDKRTEGLMEEVFKLLPKEEIYQKTGIQFLPFNTLYQLIAIKKQNPSLLDHARTFLMLPDYFHFLLTGKKICEYTNASTTQLVNINSRDWDRDLLSQLNIPLHLFSAIQFPGSRIGNLRDEVAKELGCQMEVILPPTHDTGSAFISVRNPSTTIVLSLGTWALLGIESTIPIFGDAALAGNFTNEGGYVGTYRFLKNRMGLWMIQEVKRLVGHYFTFDRLTELAEQEIFFPTIIDVNHPRFLSPTHMIDEIKLYCKENQLIEPQTEGEIVSCLCNSMVRSYLETIDEIEHISGRKYDTLQIIGGGSRNRFLQNLLKRKCRQQLSIGPL